MKTISFLSNAIEGYVKYRKASGRNSHSYVKNVILFDHFCTREYPGQTELTQEIVDRWCRQRPTECTNSCVSRVYPVLDFIKYMNKRGMTKIDLPQVPRSVPRTYTPHPFTYDELKRFFNACDNTKPRRGRLPNCCFQNRQGFQRGFYVPRDTFYIQFYFYHVVLLLGGYCFRSFFAVVIIE